MEIFQFSDEVDTYIFKIDTAKKIVADGRAALPVSPETLRAFAGMNEFDFDHLLHVDPLASGNFHPAFWRSHTAGRDASGHPLLCQAPAIPRL